MCGRKSWKSGIKQLSLEKSNECYILRVVGKLLYGPVQDEHHLTLTDATWWERLSTTTLIICVAAIGCLPNFFVKLIEFTFQKDIFAVIGLN